MERLFGEGSSEGFTVISPRLLSPLFLKLGMLRLKCACFFVIVCVQFVWISNKNTEKIEGCEQLCRIGYSLLTIARKTTAPPSTSAFSGYLTMGEFPLSKFSKQCVYQSLILFTCRKLQIECHDPLALVGKQL